MTRTFGGVIWTDHALERLRERGISQGDAWVAFRRAESSRYAASQGGWVYQKGFQSMIIEVVAKQNERKEWIILSVWSKPIYSYRKKPHWILRLLKRLFSW
jgi:hypothetical protein